MDHLTMSSSTVGHSSMMMSAHHHPGDPDKASEHMALLNLVPHSAATHVAIKSGAWSDSSTWEGGRIPGNNAKVLIKTGVEVVYDLESNARLKTVRIDGTLSFAPDQNTKMVVDTLVNAPGGTLNIGSEHQPIHSDKTARIVIADNGAIDTAWDPQQLSRGLLSHGRVEIHGQEKTSHLQLAQDAMKGDTKLVLAEVPKNWKVGDSIVLTGTHYVPDRWNGSEMVWQGTQDEELKITAIVGNQVTINKPLQYNHDTPRADLKAYVANYSRNVIVETENYAALPSNQRGHVMLMHSDDVDVRYAEFRELGRTDKSQFLDDFKVNSNGQRILDANGNPIKNDPEDITNQRGRYAFHLHRTGVENLESDPAIVVGNAVWGSPGFGFVHHDSYAILENNAAYNVFGSAFMAETGNEIGVWRNNIAIKSEGTREISKSQRRVENHDVGANGVGFWLQGRLILNEENVAASQRHSGFTYMMRGVDNLLVLANNISRPDVMARYLAQVDVDTPPIEHFRNNETLTSGMGFEVIKANPLQGHDVRSVINGLLAWEVRIGTHQEYTSKYTLTNLDLIATKSSAAKNGVEFGNNTFDMVITNSTVQGFDTGISMSKTLIGWGNRLDDWDFAFVNVDLTKNDRAFENLSPATDEVLSSSQLRAGRLELSIASDSDFIFDTSNDREVVIKGVKTDSIGSIQYPGNLEDNRLNSSKLLNRLAQGHYVDRNGTRFITFKDVIADRATAQLREYTFIIVLDNTWNQSSFGGALGRSPMIATYNGVAKPGVAAPDLVAFLAGNPVPYAAIDNPRVIDTSYDQGDHDHGDDSDHNHGGMNTAPSAIDDSAQTTVAKSVTINVLANDRDPDGDTLQLDAFTQASRGQVSRSGNALVYQPNAGFTGQDSFSYTISDGKGGFDTAIVNLVVNPASSTPETPTQPPISSANLLVNGDFSSAIATNFGITSSDSAGQGWFRAGKSVWSWAGKQAVAGGSNAPALTQVIQSQGQHRGQHNFSFDLTNSDGDSLRVMIWGVNGDFSLSQWNAEGPKGADKVVNLLDQTFTNRFTSPTRISVENINLGTGYEFLAVSLVSTGVQGGDIQRVDNVFLGSGSQGVPPAPQPQPQPGNIPPIAVDDSAQTLANYAITLNVLANDTDANGDPLSLENFGQPAHGQVVRSGNQLIYTPNRGFTGRDSFTYTITDGNGGSDNATVSLKIDPLPMKSQLTKNLVVNGDFSDPIQPNFGTNTSDMAGAGWFRAGQSVWRDANDRATSGGKNSTGLNQIIDSQGQHKGLNNLSFDLVNTGGDPLRVMIWGVNGDFQLSHWSADGPRGASQVVTLLDRTFTNRVSNPTQMQVNNINLGNGYEFLAVSLFSTGVSGRDVQWVDNLFLGGTEMVPIPVAPPQAEWVDLRGRSGSVTATLSLEQDTPGNAVVGLYRVQTETGQVLDSQGNLVNPSSSNYAQVALQQRRLNTLLSGDASKTTQLQGGELLAPFLVVNGTVEQLLDSNPGNDPSVYFPFIGANSDRADHIQALGSDTFGFEASPGGGDFDFNDLVLRVQVNR